MSIMACKMGLKHYRSIIYVDGCHLKDQFGGQMLYAIGKDKNDHMFPIAYAMVEVETRNLCS